MAKKGRAGNSYKNQYKNYKAEDREHKNRIRRLQRVARNQPNNEQAMVALDNALKNKDKHVSGRRSGGHLCKGLYKQFGFEENKPQDIHKKKAIHWYMGGYFNFKQNKDVEATLAMHGESIKYQLNKLGIK